MVRNVAEQLAGRAAVVQIETDKNQDLADRFQVRSIPVFHLLRAGQSIAQLVGVQSAEALINWFQREVKA